MDTTVHSPTLADRYVALWNEPDPDARRALVESLWTSTGSQVLAPPEEVASRASGLGLTATLSARGHDQLVDRVARAYEEFIAPGEFVFRLHDPAARLGDVVKFRWAMARADGTDDTAAIGLDVFVLAPDGRIEVDYQFIEA